MRRQSRSGSPPAPCSSARTESRRRLANMSRSSSELASLKAELAGERDRALWLLRPKMAASIRRRLRLLLLLLLLLLLRRLLWRSSSREWLRLLE